MLRSLRNFIITLLISSAIFGVAAYYTSGLLLKCLDPIFGSNALTNNDNNTDDNNTSDKNDNNRSKDSEDSFSMLIINTNYKPSEASRFSAYDVVRYPENEKDVSVSVDSIGSCPIEATDFMIIRGNSSKNEFTYTYLPASLTLTVQGYDKSLNEIYRTLGIKFLVKKITAITGFDIDYYAFYDIEDVSYIVEYISGITYNVPVDIKEGDNVLLKSGVQDLSGKDVERLLEYNGYTSTLQRNQMLVSLSKTIFSKISNKLNRIDIVALHRSSQTKVDTTMTVTAINSLTDLIYSYTGANVTEVSYPGNYKTIGGTFRFVPNIASAVSKFLKYR